MKFDQDVINGNGNVSIFREMKIEANFYYRKDIFHKVKFTLRLTVVQCFNEFEILPIKQTCNWGNVRRAQSIGLYRFIINSPNWRAGRAY